MVTWNEIQSWDAGEVAWIAHRVSSTVTELRHVIDDVASLSDMPWWQGVAADAARASLVELYREWTARADSLAVVGRCVRDTADSMYPLIALVRRLEAEADHTGMVIGSDAVVRDPLTSYSVAQNEAWETARDRSRSRRELDAQVAESVRRATVVDDAAAAQLVGSPSADVPQVPSTGTTAAHAAFWESLTTAEKTELMVNQPEAIGNLDGIPAEVRDAANRRVLVRERTRLEEVARALRQRLDGNTFGGLFDNADAGLEQTLKRLEALDAVADTLARGDRQLLVLDNSSGVDTLAAIAAGNVHTATHVAVFVPGLGSDVAGDLGRYDREMDSLKSTAQQALPGGSVACVTWMNYQAPHLGWDLLDPRRTVLSSMAGAFGAARLTPFLDGLDASRSQDPHLSLVGHSYGSLTAALALRGSDTTGVDEFVAIGSPGLGVDDVSRLSVPPGHVFVGEAPSDVVADLGVFGTDPSGMDGIRRLESSADEFGSASTGHSEYLLDGTATQRRIAHVVAGAGLPQ